MAHPPDSGHHSCALAAICFWSFERPRGSTAQEPTKLENLQDGHRRSQVGNEPQTLFRRLKAEGVTFEQVHDELRHKLALHYLAGRKVSVNETVYLVGFSEASAFSRAFKRWTGTSPRICTSPVKIPQGCHAHEHLVIALLTADTASPDTPVARYVGWVSEWPRVSEAVRR